MIPETPAWYKLVASEITRRRNEADKAKTEIDRQCDEDIGKLSTLVTAKKASCKHTGIILFKESMSGRPHEPDVYICSLCTSSLQHPPTSAEIVRVSQEELLKFFCK